MWINTLAFALAFAAWVQLGPSTRLIAAELHLSRAQGALLKTIPILVGSLLRIPLGVWVDRVGARPLFPMLLGLGGLGSWTLSRSTSTGDLVLGSVLLGLVGTTFAVGVASVCAWTPKARQGLALGIFGAGNVGTALTTFGLPFLLEAVGWRESMQIYGGLLLLAAAGYFALLPDPDRSQNSLRFRDAVEPLRDGATWHLALQYMATFGVFVALTLTLSDIYVDGFGLSLRWAGVFTTAYAVLTSVGRILGGALADRWGPQLILAAALSSACLSLTVVSLADPGLGAVLTLVCMCGVAQGIGMGAVLKDISQKFPTRVGVVGGVVGALGGVAGFYLPLTCVWARSHASITGQLLPLTLLTLLALASLPLNRRVPIVALGTS
ncbi:MFS transporter [bacterium]|nr:MFS transporter [bacterium]